MSTRLVTVNRELAARVEAATNSQQRAAAAAAALLAASVTQISGAPVDAAKAALAGGQFDPTLRPALDKFVEALDKKAWDLQEENGEDNRDAYLTAFSRARAVAALAFAMDADARTAALEGIYEAGVATDADQIRAAVLPHLPTA